MLGGNSKNLVLTTGLGSVVLGMACRAQTLGHGAGAPVPSRPLSPASPAQAAWQRRGVGGGSQQLCLGRGGPEPAVDRACSCYGSDQLDSARGNRDESVIAPSAVPARNRAEP